MVALCKLCSVNSPFTCMCSGNCCGGGSALLLYIVGYFVALCGGGGGVKSRMALPPTGPLMYIFDVYIYSEKICLLVQHVLLVASQTSTSRVPSE